MPDRAARRNASVAAIRQSLQKRRRAQHAPSLNANRAEGEAKSETLSSHDPVHERSFRSGACAVQAPAFAPVRLPALPRKEAQNTADPATRVPLLQNCLVGVLIIN